jgi:DNA-directed RNA polymerase-3 subunit RPC5
MKAAREGYDNATFIKTAIKPENQEVVIEVKINTQDSHYNINKGQAIAVNAEMSLKRDQDEDEKIFDRFVLEKLLITF